MTIPITAAARTYAVREILRRTGLPSEALRSCRIDAGQHEVTVELTQPGPLRFRFPTLIEGFSKDRMASEAIALPDFAQAALRETSIPVPCARGSATPGCLIQPDGAGISFSSDLPAAVLFLLCRIEERLIEERDRHGRFDAASSLSVSEGYLERPLVDEYAVAVREAIRMRYPNWQPAATPMRVLLTHDIDEIGIPFNPQQTAGHLVRRWNFPAMLRDALSIVRFSEPAFLSCVDVLAGISRRCGFHSAFYWKAAARSAYDTGYDPRDPRVQRTIAGLRDQGFELGAHPAYLTFANREELNLEAGRLRTALGVSRLGGRQHFLRWSPETWLDWEACGLAYDSSVVFAVRPGFRCGTCWPYHPWLIESDRVAALLECPLILMDVTLRSYMKLSVKDADALAARLIGRAALIGGVFVVLWHNNTLLDPAYGNLYARILSRLSGAPPYRPLDPPE